MKIGTDEIPIGDSYRNSVMKLSLERRLMDLKLVDVDSCFVRSYCSVEVHAISHVTGGGLANNLARVIPGSVEVRIDRASWRPAPVFNLVQRSGAISQPDLEATLQHGRRDGGRAAGRTPSTPRSTCSPGAACPPGSADPSRPAGLGHA